MNLNHETSFIVMPSQCNYMYPMIFGGAFLAELDLCAAICTTRLLHDSVCDSAVTYKVEDVTFYAAAEAGDIIFLKAEVVQLRTTAIVIEVKAYRERRNSPARDYIASSKFVFVSKLQGGVHPHGLKMPELKS